MARGWVRCAGIAPDLRGKPADLPVRPAGGACPGQRDIGQQTVSCEKHDVDRYGRVVAVCRAGGGDLSAWMVARGWALAYRHYSTACVSEEDVAHAAHIH
jgi:hypothetical protein